MRDTGKDTTARARRRYGAILPGLSTHRCTGCESELVYPIAERPTHCRMCGTQLPDAVTCSAKDFTPQKFKNETHRREYLAGRARIDNEHRGDAGDRSTSPGQVRNPRGRHH